MILDKLYDFQGRYGMESYSECFYIPEEPYDKSGITGWSSHPDFLNQLEEFACANGSGSTYAYWLINNDKDKCPIVVFGDEGGIHLVAENITDLIKLLTFDCEISVDIDKAYFFKDSVEDYDNEDEYLEDYPPSESHTEFVEWAKDNFNIEAVQNNEQSDAIIQNANKKYKTVFQEFLAQYINEN